MLLWLGLVTLGPGAALAAAPTAAAEFHERIEPLLVKYCYDCHGDGMSKGGLGLDQFKSDADLLGRREVWLAVLKNVRAGLMPPNDGGVRPEHAEISRLADWIKFGAFGTDPANPDPGRVTARRLNRFEYRNTIRDLMGVDFNSEVEFPPDDSGNGFDNNGDVLTLSPLLLEKYLAAAETIVDSAVPKVAKVVREVALTGRDFRAANGSETGDRLNVRRAVTVSRTIKVDRSDLYQLLIEMDSRGSFDFDPGQARLIGRFDGEQRFVDEIAWSAGKPLRHEFDLSLEPGEHTLSFEMEPRLSGQAGSIPTAAAVQSGPVSASEAAAARTRVEVRVTSVKLRGPMSPQFWTPARNHARFFPKGGAPEEPAARDRYATEVLRAFATHAYRRPVDDGTVTRLAAIARRVYLAPGKSFEEGVSRAMMAVLASPRFLFRVEQTEPADVALAFGRVDEYSLASRLSYFLWSTMPDEELFRLAARGELRAGLQAQVERMLKDSRAQAFVRSFTGQWLQARDVESVPINARVVLGPDAPRNRDGRVEFDSELRKLMRSETEMYFEHVLRGDRSVLELVDSDYAFLNARLATHYGVPGVSGDQLRLVKLPADSPRGGVLTQGAVLAVTSNPTRTSPVKRGLFVLDNILGTPPPPPPPDVPPLEDAAKSMGGREPKLSEVLALHRSDKRCNSCHARMDPLGLAFENFNALGGWRDTEAAQPIDAAGELITGEAFANVRELKQVLVRDRRLDFYRCLTEKLLTYAAGRGLEYYDAHTVDEIVQRLDRAEGRMSALLLGVIESAPFQKRRAVSSAPPVDSVTPPRSRPSKPQP